jgi:hypothetical protein
VGSKGVDVARLIGDDAVKYCIQLWPRLLSFSTDLLSLLAEPHT